MSDFLNIIQKSIDYIEQNIFIQLSVKKVASKTPLSNWYFQRVFRTYVGESVASYIRRRRLSLSLKDLSGTELKISEIALKYQFSSSEAFSRSFKKNFGISPDQFRGGS